MTKEASPVAEWVRKHELPRKLLHGSIGFVTLWLYTHGYQRSQIWPPLLKAVIPISICEIIRFRCKPFNDLYVRLLGPLMRPSEVKLSAVNGVIWYLLGVIYVMALLPKDLATLSVLLLSWADLAASTIGRAYGRYTPKLVGSKSLAGSLGAFATGFLACVLMYSFLLPQYAQYNTPKDITWWPSLSRLNLWELATTTGLVAAISELFPVIDDNLSLPVVSGTAMYIILRCTTQPYDFDVVTRTGFF